MATFTYTFSKGEERYVFESNNTIEYKRSLVQVLVEAQNQLPMGLLREFELKVQKAA